MSKSIVIKFIILLIVAALVYSAFWFFKTGQVEKKINNFISENSGHVSASEVAVSGFPLSQKVTIRDLKFSVPSSAIGDRQILVKLVEATTGILSSDFVVTLPEHVFVVDAEGNSANVEFSKEPEITVSLNDKGISKFHYQDSGYRISDSEKKVIYAASSSFIAFESTVDAADKVTTKISANIKDIEGFGVLDIYKNSFEKTILDGIRTGQIVISNNANSSLAPDVNTTITSVASTQPEVLNATNQINAAAQNAAASAIAAGVSKSSIDAANSKAAQDAAAGVEAVKNAMETAQDQTAQVPSLADAEGVAGIATKPEEMAAVIENDNLVKSNFIMDIEYILSPTQVEQQAAQAPMDPTQIQEEAPIQYSKIVKINNIEFSNPLYKISLNGEVNILQDDGMPSGAVSVKVEKIDNLINHVAAGFNKILEQKAKPTDSKPADLANTAVVPSEDIYQKFLERVSAGLSSVAKEVGAKNAVTKEELAVFDIRREKNLEFLVNETPAREVLGKF